MIQIINNILDSLCESKNASLVILSRLYIRKIEYFELMLNKCENKMRRHIKDFCKILKSDIGD